MPDDETILINDVEAPPPYEDPEQFTIEKNQSKLVSTNIQLYIIVVFIIIFIGAYIYVSHH
jgi:hypothetical protein